LNAKDYEYQDLKDIRKETNIGLNVTVYPNTHYNARDNAGHEIFNEGQRINKTGVTISSGIQFGYINETRDIKATIGSGVTTNFDTGNANRDTEKTIGEWKGTNIENIYLDLGTEYWLTEAGRGAFRDQIDESKLGYKRLKNLLTEKGTLGEKIGAEKLFRQWMAEGFIETDGKSKEEIIAELGQRFGVDVDIKFYNGDAIKKLTNLDLVQWDACGFAVREDGSIWINVDKLDNNAIDFNKLFFHEYAHSNGLNENQAEYVEQSYGEFLTGVSSTGYVNKNGEIENWTKTYLTGTDLGRLLGFEYDELDFKLVTMSKEKADNLKEYIRIMYGTEKKLKIVN